MSATWTDIPRVTAARPNTSTASVNLPAPQPVSTPVLIGDCATPLAGETVLSLLWKRLEADQSPE